DCRSQRPGRDRARDGRDRRHARGQAAPGARRVRRPIRALRQPARPGQDRGADPDSFVKVVAAYNIKGGVGKTAAAVNISCLAAADGFRVLLWDLDPQAATSFLFRVKPRVKGGGKGLIAGKRPVDDAIKATDFDNLDLLPADFTYRNLDLHLDSQRKSRLRGLLSPLNGEFDLVMLDCPPGISLLSENVLRAADLLLVPIIPTTLSVRTLDQLTDFVI